MSAKLEVIVVTVTTAGTRVQVSTTPIYVNNVVFVGARANTGFIYVGDVAVSSTVYSDTLASAQRAAYTVNANVLHHGRIDLSTIYIDSSVNGEKCMVTYQKSQDNV